MPINLKQISVLLQKCNKHIIQYLTPVQYLELSLSWAKMFVKMDCFVCLLCITGKFFRNNGERQWNSAVQVF